MSDDDYDLMANTQTLNIIEGVLRAITDVRNMRKFSPELKRLLIRRLQKAATN